jgi:phage virion morphogenesis protein
MAGATSTIEFDNTDALRKINAIVAQLSDPDPMLRDMGEYLIITHLRRFDQQVSPDGTSWQALSAGYLKRKKKNKDKILQLDGYLKNTNRYQVENGELLFGSDRPYAAKQHFGGETTMPARASEVFFRQNRDGSIGNKFVKKKNSNFSQSVNIGAYTINMPARPWLGTSDQDDSELLAIAQRHLERAINS